MKLFGQALVLLLLLQAPVFAKAYFFTEEELVKGAAAIAIIDLEAPVVLEMDVFNPPPAADGFSYSQKARAKCVTLIAGQLPDSFEMFGDESFICAQCKLSKGRFLAFLVKKKDIWVGVNWHLSLRPVKDGKIEWYPEPPKRYPMVFQDSEIVLTRVRTLLAAKKS
jgi:hypothetical protein